MRECQLCKNCYGDGVVTCPKDGMPTMHTLTGEPVLEGKYHLESRLGQGGMGVVYKARHAFLKTQLAVKIILPDLVGNDPQLVTRFRQEALAAAAIRHQNVVGVTDYGVLNGSIPYLVMEYVEGESLHDMLAREGVLPPERALELISAIAAGVGAAHHQGIVHRDLKPLNIMICTDRPNLSQAVKILDFGLAKIKSGELLGSFIQAQTTGLMGSPYYMAPEQWADDEPDSRSDIYSLGVMLFQMLTGDVPFKGSSIPAIMKKHISDAPPTFADVNVDLPIEIEHAVRHTLEKEKEKRTPSVEHLVAELRQAIEPVPIGIHTTSSARAAGSRFNIRTVPPRAKIFVDNVAMGESRDDGWLTLNGIQTGNHRLRVSHHGYEDWQTDVACDGTDKEITAQLRSAAAPAETVAFRAVPQDTPHNLGATGRVDGEMQATSVQSWDTGSQMMPAESIPPQKKSVFSSVAIGIAAMFGLLLVGGLGVGGAYWAGVFSSAANSSADHRPSSTPVATSTPSAADVPPAAPRIKADMVDIPGGTFMMGKNGETNANPAHSVTVDPFKMDKTEVTNEEYLEFVQASGRTAPMHWVQGRPLAGTEKLPVRFVSFDDAEAFAKWRSERDKVEYALPTEQQWEFAARNGAKETAFPWGSAWDADRAVYGVADGEPRPVGSKPDGADEWGVVDLIGNVWEWTRSDIAPYPGANVERIEPPKGSKGRRVVVRGGSAYDNPSKIIVDATYRADVSVSQKEKNLGFRLVRAK